MDSLPVEILAEILAHLPPAARPAARLASRPFHALLARHSFRTLRAFLLDPPAAPAALRAVLHDLPARPRSLWSPECSVPDGLPLPGSFLRAACAALDGGGGGGGGGQPVSAGSRRQRPQQQQQQPPPALMLADSSEDESSSDGGEGGGGGGRLGPEEQEEDGGGVSPEAMLQRLARADVDEQTLRETLFRYALYKSYFYDGDGEAPQLWVMDSAKWKYQV